MTTQWLPFLILCFAVELTPGPNMAYLAILTSGAGRRAGFAAMVGIALGLGIIGALAAFGVAEIVSNSPLLSKLLSAAGVFYLLWLAIDTWRAPQAVASHEARAVLRHYFTRGLITNLLNLKNPSESVAGMDLVPLKSKAKKVTAALSNSFGFGGTNASLVFKAAS